MPVGVVVGLEVVEVEHPERDRRALALGALELTRELLVERAPVADLRQRVDARELLELGQRRRALDRDRRLARQQLDQLQLALGDLRRLAAPEHGQHAHDLVGRRQRLEGARSPLRQPEAVGARAVLALAAVERDRACPRRARAGARSRRCRGRRRRRRAACRRGSPSTGPRRRRRPARRPRRTARSRTRPRPTRARAGSSPRRAGAASSTLRRVRARGGRARRARRPPRRARAGSRGRRRSACAAARRPRTRCRCAARRRSPARRRRSRAPSSSRRSAGRAVASGTTSVSSSSTACAQNESARGASSPLAIPKPAFVHWRAVSTRLNAATGAPSSRAVSATSSSKAGSAAVSSRAVLRSASRRWGSPAGMGADCITRGSS